MDRQNQIEAESQNVQEEIRKKAEIAAERRLTQPPKSPRSKYASKQKMKAKRNSKKFERLLSRTKENLSKVLWFIVFWIYRQICNFFYLYRQASDRVLQELPVGPKSLFDQIHDPIVSGQAKKNLKPVVIVIE